MKTCADVQEGERNFMKKRVLFTVMMGALSMGLLCSCGKESKKETTDLEILTESKEATRATDISNAKNIKTAVETALSSEENFELLTVKHAGKMILVTEDGLGNISKSLRDEVLNTIGGVPTIDNGVNNATNFAFTVNSSGMVTVYACTLDKREKWELCPNADSNY